MPRFDLHLSLELKANTYAVTGWKLSPQEAEWTILNSQKSFSGTGLKNKSVLPPIGFFALRRLFSKESISPVVAGVRVCTHAYMCIVAVQVELLLCFPSLADKYSVEVSSHVHHTLVLSSWNQPLCVGTFMMHWNLEVFLIKFAIPQPAGDARNLSMILRSSWHCALAS